MELLQSKTSNVKAKIPYGRLFADNNRRNDKYLCEVCDYDCGSLNDYYFHLESHTLKDLKKFGKYKCSHCSMSFVDYNDLMQHLQSIINHDLPAQSSGYYCQLCNFTCEALYDFVNHSFTHQPAEPTTDYYHECPKCRQRFSSLREMRWHIKLNHNISDKDNFCHICYEVFPNERVLMMHVQFHRIAEPFCCQHCYQKFENVKAFKQHYPVHFGQDFVAPILNTPQHLASKLNHQKSFSEAERSDCRNSSALEELFKCSYCDADFRLKDDLDDHMRGHMIQNSFKCPLCPKSFINERNLEKHKAIHAATYKCDLCEKGFSQQSTLNFHRKLHFRDKLSCEFCNKQFGLLDHLTRHKRVHTKEKPYHCSYCEKSFSQSNSLTAHIRIHSGERPYICGVCPKKFKVQDHLNKHMRTHTGEKPFKCLLCPSKSFSQQTGLKQHMKQHLGLRLEQPEMAAYANNTAIATATMNYNNGLSQ